MEWAGNTFPGRSDVKDVTGDYPALYGWELGRIELDHTGKPGTAFPSIRCGSISG